LSCFISRTREKKFERGRENGKKRTKEREREREGERGREGGRRREREREREKERKEEKAKKGKRSKERNARDSPILARRIMTFSPRTSHAYACATEEGLFSVRERPTTLYIFISRALVLHGRKEAQDGAG